MLFSKNNTVKLWLCGWTPLYKSHPFSATKALHSFCHTAHTMHLNWKITVKLGGRYRELPPDLGVGWGEQGNIQ